METCWEWVQERKKPMELKGLAHVFFPLVKCLSSTKKNKKNKTSVATVDPSVN